jgi:hypothetical protein
VENVEGRRAKKKQYNKELYNNKQNVEIAVDNNDQKNSDVGDTHK